jgi:hypothetical protein
MATRCARCYPGTIHLGCDAHGHMLSGMLARAGWRAGSEKELVADLDAALRPIRNVGPAMRALVAERLQVVPRGHIRGTRRRQGTTDNDKR